ncbi:hypothetical protein ABGN35_001184 [Yersinia enterocolitica]
MPQDGKSIASSLHEISAEGGNLAVNGDDREAFYREKRHNCPLFNTQITYSI